MLTSPYLVADEPTAGAAHVAALFLDLVPIFFRVQRAEVKKGGDWNLSVPQMRTLRFINRCPNISLSEVAGHLDMTLPATSKIVDRLMQMELLTRDVDPQDRRRAVLHLTDAGREWLHGLSQAIQDTLATRLECLPEETLQQCIHTLSLLHEVLLANDADVRTCA